MNKIEDAGVVDGEVSQTTLTSSLKSAVGGAVELIRDRRFDLCVHRRGDLSHTIQTVVDLAVRVREAACLDRESARGSLSGTTAPPVRPGARPIRIHGRALRAQSKERRPSAVETCEWQCVGLRAPRRHHHLCSESPSPDLMLQLK